MTPGMSPRWLKLLEKFGSSTTPTIGVEEDDLEWALDDESKHKRYDVLFHLYGPVGESPWVPYHCPTLFASIDRLSIDPSNAALSPGYEEEHPPGAWEWIDEQTMVIVDLPGATTIEVGVTLMKQMAQLVCTFDHWPSSTRNRSADTVVDADEIIDMMYTLAPEAAEVYPNLSPSAPPVWLCDSRRLGDDEPDPTPGTFDNRYYIDDSILPGIPTLNKAGIRRVVYFNERLDDDPLPDVAPFIVDSSKQKGITVERVALTEKETWIEPKPIERLPFETKLPIRSFKRSDLGGFGKLVPQPSEGSYSSGGVGG